MLKPIFRGGFWGRLYYFESIYGFDSITPYLKYIESGSKGIFVLLRTSNQGAKDIQYLKVQEAKGTIPGASLYYHVGDRLMR